MKNARNLLALAAAALMATSGMAMTKEEYNAGKDRIGADYKAAKAPTDSDGDGVLHITHIQAEASGLVAVDIDGQHRQAGGLFHLHFRGAV